MDSDDEGKDDHDDKLLAMATSELLVLADKMEAGYVSRVGMDSLLDFLHHLCAFQASVAVISACCRLRTISRCQLTKQCTEPSPPSLYSSQVTALVTKATTHRLAKNKPNL